MQPARAQMLAKRAQLVLSVPAQYSGQADGAALRQRLVRLELARRAGIDLETGENPGPLDLRDGAVRSALREMYAERFGPAELSRQKKIAEDTAADGNETGTVDNDTVAAKARLPLLQRVGKLMQGEPQVADARAFYRTLRARLDQEQPLPADALTTLGVRRSGAIQAALKDGGVDPARLRAASPRKMNIEVGKAVPVRLELEQASGVK